MRIFVIDDNPDDRFLAVREIRRGFPHAELVEVESGEELSGALEGPRPTLVITDYRMGWMDGLDVLRLVKALDPDIPVIMLTGTGGETVAVEAMRSGVDDYLLKRGHEYARLPVSIAAALDRARDRRASREAQERYHSLFRHVPVGLALVGPDGQAIEVNEALIAMLGVRPDAAAGLSRLTEALAGAGREAWHAAISGGAAETALPRLDGRSTPVVVRARRVDGRDGAPLFEAAFTDISDIRRAQEERTVLLAELYHRVNNNLQLLISFVLTLANRTVDPEMKRALEELSARIHSIALVQARLYKSGDYARVNIREFLEELLTSLLQGTAVRLRADLDDVVVPVNKAVPIGLIANEVLLNALKHAFPAADTPEIRVSLGNADAGTSSNAVIVVEDNGIGLPDEGTQRTSSGSGYGTRLLRSLARQAGAKVETSSAPGRGTRVTVRFPKG